MKRRWPTWPLAAIACIGSLAAVIGTAQAQARDDAASYPTRPVRFLTPAAPGDTTDILARLFSERLTQEWKQPFLVDSRASASGVLAAESTANAAPDGHTLLPTISIRSTQPCCPSCLITPSTASRPSRS